jgi:hypothetical protein
MKAWEDVWVKRLTSLWADSSVSKAAIADILTKEFGVTFTRNAISGKANMLKLARRDGILRTEEAGEKERAGRRKEAKASGSLSIMLDRAQAIEGGEFKGAGIDLEVPDAQFVCKALDLENESCRYPIGSRGAYAHCGFPEANMIRNMPYCAFHAQRCGTMYSSRAR